MKDLTTLFHLVPTLKRTQVLSAASSLRTFSTPSQEVFSQHFSPTLTSSLDSSMQLLLRSLLRRLVVQPSQAMFFHLPLPEPMPMEALVHLVAQSMVFTLDLKT
jgi:hypothetical protein